MATQIGVVKAMIGEVTATAADGSIRTLQVGDMVYANELISTGQGGAVEIEFADGSVMDLGRNSQAMLDSEVFDPDATAVAETASDDVPDDVAAIQQALLEGEDPTEIGEATAAGAGVEGGNEGHEAVFVDYLNPEVTPEAGFDTVGVTNEFDQPEEDIIFVDEALPTLSINDVTVIEPDGGFLGGTSGSYNIIYVIDVSGSMNTGSRLADTKQAIITLNQQIIDAGIADNTEIAIIPFSSGVDGSGTRAPTFYTSADLDANSNGINDIEEYINALFASGGTSFTPPLEVAEDWLDGTLDGTVRYENSDNIIFFISDGVGSFNSTDPDIQALYDSSTIDAQIISIGITSGASLTTLDVVDDLDGTNDSAIQVLDTADLESVLTELVQGNGGEGGSTPGTVIAEFTVTLSEPSDVDVTVSFTTADGTAISGGTGVAENDYGSTSGTLTIPAGSTSATIQVTVFGDSVTEITEQYLVQLGSPVNAVIADGTGVGTILDNDPIDFSISSTPTISEDNEETATFTVQMDGALAVGVTASVQLNLGTGTATDSVDYDAFEQAVIDAAALETGVSYDSSTNTLTFDSDFDGSFDFTVDAINDQLVEGTESIIAELSNASVTGGFSVATISTPATTTDITENDAAISFAIDSTTSISEDAEETATFSVTMSGGPLAAGETASVQLDLGTGTATDSTDYDAFEAAVIAAAGSETGVSYDAATNVLTFTSDFDGQFDFSVDAIDDNSVEGTETIIADLSNATVSNGTASITTPSTTTNITENDAAISFAIDSTTSISEDAEETATFSVTMSGGPLSAGETASVQLDLGAGTATDSTDYDAFEAAVIAAAGSETGVSYDAATNVLTFTSDFDGQFDFSVDAIDDSLVEGTETIVGELSNATVSNGTATITTPSTTTNITENDAAISFAINSTASISEDAEETATFSVTMSGGPLSAGETASVQLDLGAGTATDSTDYDAFEAAVIAAAGSETGVSYDAATNVLTFTSDFDGQFDFSVDAIDDNSVEGTETIIADLSNATVSNGTVSITTPSTTTNITENDAAVSFAVNVASEDAANDSSTQSATIAEEVLTDNEGTFSITKGGGALTGSNTATVTITVSGSAEDADFVGMSGTDYADVVAAIKAAAETAGLTVTNEDGDSLDVTWAAGDASSFDVDLTAFDDGDLDSPEALTLTLSGASVDAGNATLESGEEAATLNITDVDAEPTAGAVSALVDDDGLTDGIPDGIDDDTPDADPDNDESTYSGTLAFDFGDNGAGSIDFAGMDGDTGTLGTENIAYSWDGNTNTLTASITSGDRNGTDLFTVTVNPATGAYTVKLLTNVLHDSLDDQAGDDTENNDSVSLTYTVRDSDTDTADGTLTIDFDDDSPTIDPVKTGVMVNQAGNIFVDDISIEYGADGFGDALLAGTFADDGGTDYWTNTEGEFLLSGGMKLQYVVENDGSLSAYVEGDDPSQADPVFTVTYDEVAGTYTVNQISDLDGAEALTTIGLTGGYGGGNTGDPALFPSIEADNNGDFAVGSIMIVATPHDDPNNPIDDGNTVNFNNNGLGVSQGSKINYNGDNEVLVLNLTEGEDWEVIGNNDPTPVGGTPDRVYTYAATLSFWNYSADEVAYVEVYDSDTDDLIASFTYGVDGTINEDGSWTITTTIEEGQFDEIRISDVSDSGNGFGVSQIVVTEGGQGFDNTIGLSIDAEDGDGDAVTDDWEFTFNGDGVVNGTSGDDKLQGNGESDSLAGGEGNDVLVGGAGDDILMGGAGDDMLFGGDGDDTLVGGLGDDILTGGQGADTFVWNDGDTGTDEITDFNTSEGDVLNLADLLDPTGALDIGGNENLDDYLKASFDNVTNTTTIDVYTNGDANSAGSIDQSIVINGDMTDLTTLLNNGNLNVDQS